MNNLNSALLEGKLVQDASISLTGSCMASFVMASKRYFKSAVDLVCEDEAGDSGMCVQTNFILVEVQGNRALIERVEAYGKAGRECRVVGRIESQPCGCSSKTPDQWRTPAEYMQSCFKVVLVAEHIEFRPLKGEEK